MAITVPVRPRAIPAGPSRHVYDVIVIGEELGGPLCAALLQKRGYRVLLVEHDGLGHGYEHRDHLLPYSPFVMPALRTMPLVEDALKELGLNTTVQRTLQQPVPGLQLIFDRQRVDLHSDVVRRKAELLREFGPPGETVDTALQAFSTQYEQTDKFIKAVPDLPPIGLLNTWKTRREVRKHSEIDAPPKLASSEPPAQLLSALLPYVTWLDDASTPLARTRPLSQVLHGAHHYPGGREGLRELLMKKLQDLGGDVLARERSDAFVVEQLTFEGGKLAGVQVLQSSNVYRAGAFVAATDAGALRRLIPDKKKHRAVTEFLDSVETRRFLFSVNWVIPESLLPRGMGELVLAQTKDDLETLLIQVQTARGPDLTPVPELRVVCAAAFVPASVRDLGEQRLKEVKAQIEGHLDRLMPFVRPKVLLSSAPYLDAGGVRGSRLLPHPLLRVDAEPFAGVTGLSPQTPLRNLFLASREVLPGLGLEGEYLAGIRAARLVHDLLHKNKHLKR